MIRTANFIVNLILNGVFLYSVYLMILFAFFWFSPTSWYFQYFSVEPVAKPVEIGSDFILMESDLRVVTDGNLRWNDVLRCSQTNGIFTFFSNYDTEADMVFRTERRATQWEYRGELPTEESTCRMYSTITRELPFGIQKQQVITSETFDIIKP